MNKFSLRSHFETFFRNRRFLVNIMIPIKAKSTLAMMNFASHMSMTGVVDMRISPKPIVQ